MKKVRVLSVLFDNQLHGHEVVAFRGAVIQKSGLQHSIFHNHMPNGSFIYRYPFIQYKCIRGRPMLFCIEQGVDEAHNFFNNKSWAIDISGRTLNLKVEQLNLHSHLLHIWQRMFPYRIHRWLALNQHNYSRYKLLQTDEEKRQLLMGILTGNILSFAKHVGWTIDAPIRLVIDRVIRATVVRYKGVHFQAFDLNFYSNVSLPKWLSLGKGASHGFGIVTPIAQVAKTQS